jgi:uncharacterized membrane protein YfcA
MRSFATMLPMVFPQLIIWGFLAGFLGGLLGIGGGLIFVLVIPAVALKLGASPENLVSITIANSLACTFFTTLAAGFKTFLSDKFIRKSVIIIGLSSTMISLLVLRFIVNPGILTAKAFHYVFLAILLYLIVRIFLKWNQKESTRRENIRNSIPALLGTGFFSGIVSPLSGLGGGIVVVPLLHALLNFPMLQARTISFGVIAISTLVSTLYNLFEKSGLPAGTPAIGLILTPLLLSLAPAAVAGSLSGSYFAGKLSPGWASGLLLILLLFIFVRKVLNPL